MKNIKNHIVETLPKSNIKIADRGKIDTPNTQILDHSFSVGIKLTTVMLISTKPIV
jgi:hypothetical protein